MLDKQKEKRAFWAKGIAWQNPEGTAEPGAFGALLTVGNG